MDLTTYLRTKGFFEFEGYSKEVPGQVADLTALSSAETAQRIMEIGFNAGHSAEIFLRSNPHCTVTSFDLGIHNYLQAGKEYIDACFPGRHTLIVGDSKHTVADFADANPSASFDLIFIDGGHEYQQALVDMENCRRVAHPNTVVIMDDTTFIPAWACGHTVGPSRVWEEYVQTNQVVELGRQHYSPGRGMCWGKYVFP